MRSVKKFLDHGTKDQYQRMHREALIYQLICMYDTGYSSSENVADGKMTLGAKRRLRNKIFFEAKKMVEDNAKRGIDTSVNDVDIIVSAFKKSVSNLSVFKSKMDKIESDWAEGSDVRTKVLFSITSWDGKNYLLASPCDPYFVKSDGFSEEFDGFGYIPLNSNDMNVAKMESVIVSNHLNVVDYSLNEIQNPHFVNRVLDGPLYASGFSDISHYIKSADVDAVKSFLLSNDIRPVTNDERDFMREVCEMMSRNGYDFTIVPEGKNKLRLKMTGGTEIRLLDLKEPQYNGRIYDNGIISHLALSKSKGIDSNSIINNRDRLQAIRWYFGIQDHGPILVEESEKSGNMQIRKTLKVGEQAIHKSGVKRNKGMTSVSAGTGRSDNNSILLRAIDIDPRLNQGASTNAVKLVMTTAVTTSHESDEMLFRKSFGNISLLHMQNNVSEGDWSKLKARIASDFPEYMPTSDRVTVVDDNGQSKTVLKDFVDSDNFSYYQKLPVYLALRNWVESAKIRHASLMAFDNQLDDSDKTSYSSRFSKLLEDVTAYKLNNNYYPETTGDEDVDELRSIYWKMLTKQIKIDGLLKYLRDDDGFDLDTINENQMLILIDRHYQDYLQNEFGVLPDIQVPGMPTVDNTGKGFNPEKVAKYTISNGSSGVQKNYDYIRHMLSRLEGDYTPDWIIGDTYIGNQIKNDLIRYDVSTQQGSFRFASILNEYNNVRPDAKERILKNNPGLANKPVTVEMMIHIGETLLTSGFDKDSIILSIDDNGIVKYEGSQINAVELDSKDINAGKYMGQKVTNKVGYIGQIFEPDKYGVIDPKYVVDTGNVFVPGYQVYLEQNDPENPEELMSRIRGVGWKKLMRQKITKELRRGAFQIPGEYGFVPRCAALNTVYRKAYDTVLERIDYEDHITAHEQNPTPETLTYINILKDLSGRCRFSNDIGDNASTMAQSMLEHPDRQESQQYDYFYSDLYENKNIRVLDSSFDGLFDPNATGTAKTQGVVRYLAVGASFDDKTGHPIPVEFGPDEPVPECALMQDDLMRYKNHNTWDRRLMAFSQILTAWHTPRNVGVSMMNVKGLTFDDGFVVSKKFAEKYAVKNTKGEVRPLVAQDKLSDMHGNKGVISLVVDPELHSDNIVKALVDEYDFDKFNDESDVSGVMEIVYRNKKYHIPFDSNLDISIPLQVAYYIQKDLGVYGFDDVMKVFGDNESLDVIMAPYSGMSRFNGGSMVTLLEDSDKSKNLILNGQVIEGGIGYTDLIVVDMLADVKTHFYTEDAVREGKGRKASGQLAWALQSKGANMIMKEFYGDNAKAFDDLREYSLAIGLDWNESFEPVIGYHPQTFRGEKRKLICLPELDSTQVLKFTKQSLNKGDLLINDDAYREISDKIMQELNENGGFMELPFQLDFKSAENVSGLVGKNHIPKDAFLLQKTGHCYSYFDEDGNKVVQETYGLPVLSHSLRSNQEFQDNTSKISEYTRRYVDIYMASVMYKCVQEHVKKAKDDLDASSAKLVSFKGLSTSDEYKKLKQENDKLLLIYSVLSQSETLDRFVRKAQDSLDKITKDIRDRRFDSKYNVIRDSIMAKRLSNSATAVWSADPRLKSDEVAMSFSNAVALGLTTKFSGNDMFDETRKDVFANKVISGISSGSIYREYVDENGEVKFDHVSHESQIQQSDVVHRLNVNPSVLVWRDPVLHDGNVRYMRVVIDNRIMGCSINPLMDASFDGDFDGDSVALVALQTDEANKQAYTAFSFETNLLNVGVKQEIQNPSNPKDVIIGHPLYIQKGLDTAAMMYNDPALKIERAQIEFDVNKFERMVKDLQSGLISESDFTKLYQSYRVDKETGQKVLKDVKFIINDIRKGFKQRIDTWMDKALDGIGQDIIRVDTPEHLIASLQHIVDDGAKGNQSKMHDLCENIGVIYDTDSSGKAKPSSAKKVLDKAGNWISVNTLNGVQRQVDNAIQETAAYKADNTQLGGTAAQKGVAAFRDVDIHAALEITYPVTQAILQSKHDPKDAKIKDEIVRFWGNDCWNGYKLTGDWSDSTSVEDLQNTPHVRVVRPIFDPVTGSPIPVTYYDVKSNSMMEKKDKYGNTVYETEYVKCSRDEWVQQMKGMMRALKVDDSINPDYIECLADAMVQGEGYGQAISSETNRPITYRDGNVTRVVRSGKNDTVLGVSDYIKQRGTLLDQMAYVNKYGAFLNRALMSCDGYVDNINGKSKQYLLEHRLSERNNVVSVIGNAVTETMSIKTAEEAIVNAKVDAVEASKTDKLVKKAAVKQAESEYKDAMSNLSNSGMFVPQNVIVELYGDKKRTEKVEKFVKTVHVDMYDSYGNKKSLDKLTEDVVSAIHSGSYADEERESLLRTWNNDIIVNETVVYKSKKKVTMKSVPKPVGRKDCLLSLDEYENGVAYMCESQESYDKRKAKALEKMISLENDLMNKSNDLVIDNKPEKRALEVNLMIDKSDIHQDVSFCD